MKLSPFAAIGPALIANGYSAIPIHPTGKMPGAWTNGQWHVMRGWSRFCAELPNETEVGQWTRWPDANVGVACGRGLLAFDIDRDDLVDPIRAVLPISRVAKRGRKGETLFYRGDTSVIRSRGFKIDGLGVMDLISDGKQTVLPPSIHPNTGEPYEWTSEGMLTDHPLDWMEEVTEEHVLAVIGVLEEHGYKAEDQSRYIRAATVPGAPIEAGDATASGVGDFYRTLNEDALRNLMAWVPRLGLGRLSRQGDGFRSVAEWRPSNSGNPLHKRPLLLSISPKGIVDYGDGDKGYTAINLVMAAHDMADWQLDKAAVWLGEALGYDFAPAIILNGTKTDSGEQGTPSLAPASQSSRMEPPAAQGCLGAPEAEPAHFEASVELEQAIPEEVIPPADASHEEEMDALTYVPGLVGELVDWMVAANEAPNRTLAFASAIVVAGTFAGRMYASPTNLRSNMYTLGLAPTGFGKEHARTCVSSLLAKAGADKLMGGSRIMSGSAMRKRVETQPTIFWNVDEFGGFMGEINNKKNTHSYQIRDHLLEYFGTAAHTFRGADYAGEQAVPCHNPNVSIYGTSTQSDFWGACRSLSVSDGLLPRFLIFSVGEKYQPLVKASASPTQPPSALVAGLQELARPKVGGNMNGMGGGSKPAEAYRVPWGRGAEDRYFSVREKYRRMAYDSGSDEAPFFNRVVEHAQKLAMILAIGVNATHPVLTLDLFNHALKVAELCARVTLGEVSGRLADNDRQREHIDVKRWIVEAGADGVSRTRLSKRVNGRFDKRRLDDILQTLVEVSKEVDSLIMQGKRGRPGARFVAKQFLGGTDPDD